MNTFDNQVQVIGSQVQYYFVITTVLTSLLAVFVVVVDRMWEKLPARSPAAFRMITEAPNDSLETAWDTERLASKVV